MTPRTATAAELERRLGYTFKDVALLERALTHSSVGDGTRKVANNERLEFLGDRVLGLVMAEALFRHFPIAPEGELALRINVLIDGKSCAEIARMWDVGSALRLPGGEARRGARDQDVFLADACEAIIAAVFIDSGWEAAKACVLAAWGDRIAAPLPPRALNPKTRLQEWALAAKRPLPTYAIVERSGPDHAPVFRVRVSVEGHDTAEGDGGSRQAAETAAAQTLLTREGVA